MCQAPDRLGGYIQSGNKRTYVYVIGSTEYQSLTVPAGTPHQEASRSTSRRARAAKASTRPTATCSTPPQAKHVDPDRGHLLVHADQAGQTGTFTVHRDGQYVSQFTLTVPGASVQLDISDVGTSPPVALPAGAKVVELRHHSPADRHGLTP